MGSSTRTVGSVLGGILRVISSTARSIADAFDTVVDFAAVKVFGVPFVVLGYRQTGKTTLLEWLRTDFMVPEPFDPDPTAAGGDPIPAFAADIGADGERMKIKPKRDVGGEYSMWETDWVDLFQQARPRGIIFMIDHSEPFQHKDAMNFMFQLLEDEVEARRNLEMVVLLVNKADLWDGELTLDDVLEHFRNETRRLKSQAERLGYNYMIASSSLVRDEGPREVMTRFFDAIRPKSQLESEDQSAG